MPRHAVVADLRQEAGIEIDRIDEVEQRAPRVGVGDHGRRASISVPSSSTTPAARPSRTRMRATDAPVRISAPASLRGVRHRRGQRAGASLDHDAAAARRRIDWPRSAAAPRPCPADHGPAPCRRSRARRSPPAAGRSRTIRRRDRRPPSAPSAAAGSRPSCPSARNRSPDLQQFPQLAAPPVRRATAASSRARPPRNAAEPRQRRAELRVARRVARPRTRGSPRRSARRRSRSASARPSGASATSRGSGRTNSTRAARAACRGRPRRGAARSRAPARTAEARRDLLGHRRAADHVAPLEHERLQPGLAR